jgi:hypothetical protein
LGLAGIEQREPELRFGKTEWETNREWGVKGKGSQRKLGLLKVEMGQLKKLKRASQNWIVKME